MASIGMAMQWATEKFEQDRRRREEVNRYLAGSDLFDSQMRQATRAQETEELAQQESDRVKDIFTQHKSRIQRGDKQAFADFLNETLAPEGRGAILEGNEVVEIDESGRPIRTLYDLTDMTGAQMIASGQQLVPTADQVAATYTQAAQNTANQVFELNKIMLQGQNSLATAALRGQYDLAGASMGASAMNAANNISLAKLYADRDSELQSIADNEALVQINPNWRSAVDPITNQRFVYDEVTGERPELTSEQQTQRRNVGRQIYTAASMSPANQPFAFTAAGNTNMYAVQQQQQAQVAQNLAAIQGAANSAQSRAAQIAATNNAVRSAADASRALGMSGFTPAPVSTAPPYASSAASYNPSAQQLYGNILPGASTYGAARPF